MNILEKIQNNFRDFANKPAFCTNGNYYNYKELADIIYNIADSLSDYCENSRIGLITYDDVETYASVFSIWWKNCIFIPIHPDTPPERNKLITEQASLDAILTSKPSEINNIFDKTSIKIISTSGTSTESKPIPLPVTDPESIAYIFFTSGSTGVPKGVPLTHFNLSSFTDAFFKLGYILDDKDRCLQMFDMTFDLSLMSYIIPLMTGACVYPIPSDMIKYTGAYTILEDYNITIALMVPSVLSYLRPYFGEISLPHLRYSLFCGEALYADITAEWAKCVPNALIQNVYGPTEATIFCLTYNFPRDKNSAKEMNGIICIGKPMANMLAIIADENNNILADNTTGELCLAGAQLTPGYWRNPEKNISSFFEKDYNGTLTKFYRTGDLCYYDQSGDFFFCGRVDSQVKIQGFRVELSEIEHHVRNLTNLNVAAVAVQNKIGNTEIALFIENYNADINKISEHLKTKVPSYMIPAHLKTIEVFPLNANGKTDRKALKKIIEENH